MHRLISPTHRTRRLAALGALALGLVACGVGDNTSGPSRSSTAAAAQAESPPRSAVGHLRALQRVADTHGGNRAAGTAGDRASQAYVAERLRAAGWTVRLEPVTFPYFRERTPPRLGGVATRNFRTIGYSGSGRVSARTDRARGRGCSDADWRGVARGRVAVVERGTCTFARKAALAQARGAAAILVLSDSGVADANLGAPGTRIPAVIVDAGVGRAILRRGRATVRVDAISERRRTRNVIAERAGTAQPAEGAAPGRIVVAGAHLDSVPAGPGANDNASGVAALLATAERLGPTPLTVRIGFWGAEELGVVGSRAHVRRLTQAERERIVGYVNLDMVGTRGGRVRISSADARLRDALVAAHRAVGRDPRSSSELDGGSDQASFAEAGIPSSFVFTGLDDCYHRRCDTADRVDTALLTDVSGATESALRSLASGAP